MPLTICIPTYTLNSYLEAVALRAIRSYQGKIIVSEDGGNYSEKIRESVDTYIYNKENKGFTGNVNRLLRYCTDDFCAIVNSDTTLVEGDLSDLCIKGKVTSPEIINQNIELMAGAFFVVPQGVKEARGLLREEMRTYCSDSEYEQRIKDIFKRVPSVKIAHQQAQTVTMAGVEGKDEQARDRQIYKSL